MKQMLDSMMYQFYEPQMHDRYIETDNVCLRACMYSVCQCL